MKELGHDCTDVELEDYIRNKIAHIANAEVDFWCVGYAEFALNFRMGVNSIRGGEDCVCLRKTLKTHLNRFAPRPTKLNLSIMLNTGSDISLDAINKLYEIAEYVIEHCVIMLEKQDCEIYI